MLKRNSLLAAFEKEQMQNSKPDFFRNLRIFEALYEEAKQLGVFPLQDPLEGIEVDIRLAKVLNAPKMAKKDYPQC
jgi:hypothetical protein